MTSTSDIERADTVNLSPPWYTLRNEIAASVGNDPTVIVGKLNTTHLPYIVPVQASTLEQAAALAVLLRPKFVMGNITVEVQITDKAGDIPIALPAETPEQLAALVHTAFQQNGWFRQVVVSSPTPHRAAVYPVFAAGVIQFYNDDLSDLYRNYNNVVATVFRNVLQAAPGGIPLLSSTEEATA
jgi:hypothetical protein